MKFNLRAILPRFEVTLNQQIYKLACAFFFTLVLTQTIQAQEPQALPSPTPERGIGLGNEQNKSNSGANQPDARASRPELVLQTGVTLPVKMMAFSPDNRLLATLDYFGNIKLWETATGRELVTLNAKADLEFSIASTITFNADGSSLIVFKASAIQEFDTKTGRQIRESRISQNLNFTSAVFSRDGRLLATIAGNNNLTIWDTSNAQKKASIDFDIKKLNMIHAVAVSPDGKNVATIEGMSHELKLVLRDIAQLQERQRTKLSGSGGFSAREIRGITYSPDGRILGVLLADANVATAATLQNRSVIQKVQTTVEVYEASSWHALRSFIIPDTPSNFFSNVGNLLTFSPDSKSCAVVSKERVVRLFDVTTERDIAAQMEARGFGALKRENS